LRSTLLDPELVRPRRTTLYLERNRDIFDLATHNVDSLPGCPDNWWAFTPPSHLYLLAARA